MSRLASVALLLVTVLVAAGCGGSTVADQQLSLAALSRSASSSAEASSGRFAFDMTLELPGAQEGLAFSGEGAFDKESDRASFSVDMSAFAKLLGGFVGALGAAAGTDAPDFDDPDAWKIDAVQDGKVTYVRFPAVSKSLPAGKTWIRADGQSLKVDGFDVGGLERSARTDPRQLLEVLKAAGGEVETVGAESLRGTDTTHYRATIDPNVVAKLGVGTNPSLTPLTEQAHVSTVPVDVWLDGSGLVRKLTLSLSATEAQSAGSGRASMSFELWDYGETVDVAVPPADEVVDASALHS